MRLTGYLLIAVILLTAMSFTGCGLTRQKRTKTTDFSQNRATENVAKTTSPTENPVMPAAESDVIRVDRNDIAHIKVGTTDGLFIGDFVDATDTRTNVPIIHLSYGAPKWGTIKVYGSGHYRYYPPKAACTDEIPVTLHTTDGKTKDIVFTIEVTGASVPQTVAPNKSFAPTTASFTIISPGSWEKITSHVCNISGTAPASMNGRRVKLFVETQYGDKWEQGATPEINNGRFEGVVYIGTQSGIGVGESYTIWAEASGKSSNRVAVKRTK